MPGNASAEDPFPTAGPQGRRAALVWACAAGASLLGASVGVGWAADLPVMRSVIRGAVEMKANTAAALVVLALVVGLHSRPPTPIRRASAATLALATALLGAATLMQYLFGWQLGIDEFLVRDTGAAFNEVRGRMSPYSAVAFIALGLAGAAHAGWRRALPVRLLAAVAVAIAILSLVGYLWNASEIVTDRVVPPVAINTAVGFLLLGTAFLMLATAAPQGLPQRPRKRLETLLLGGLVPTLVAVLVGGGITYQSGANYAWAAERVAHTQEVRAVLGLVHAAITDAEAAQAKIILLDAERHDVDFAAEAEAARRHAATLAVLLADNPEQALRQQRLRALLEERLATLAGITKLYRDEGQDAARRGYLDDVKRGGNTPVRTLILQMDLAEEQLLRARLGRVQVQRNTTLVALLATLALLTLVTLALFRAIHREVVARNRAEGELQSLNAVLEQRIAQRTHQLSFQQAFLQRVLDLNRSLIYATDREGRFVLANPAVAEALGTTPQALAGSQAHELHPAARQLAAADRQVFERGEDLVILQEAFTDAHGRQRWLSTVKCPILSPDGRSTIVLGVSIDITERKAAEDEARELATDLERRVQARTLALHETNLQLDQARRDADAANRAKSAFLANMSHEIRTPMNAIIGLTHLMLREAADPTQRERLGQVGDAARHLLQLINDVLDMSKIEAGKMSLVEAPFSLGALLAGATSMVGARAREKGLALATEAHELPDDLPDALVGDAMRLSQVLLNLLSNAVKFTERGFVRLRVQVVEREGDARLLRFEVEDSGPGISPALQAQLFMPFEQGDASTVRPHGGTGLGLALSRELARAMGGDAGVHSTPGAGSRVWFTARVRLATPQDTTLAMVAAARRSADGGPDASAEGLLRAQHRGQRVLLAEDNAINRKVAQALLRAAGLEVESAADGRQAVALATTQPYALVLMDMQMPVMDGLEATRAIRQRLGPQLPIIAMTANAFAEDREACLAAGMDDHLVKPVDPQQLYATLLRWLPPGT